MYRTVIRCRRFGWAAALSLLVVSATAAFADVGAIRENLDKYWSYRGRLRTEFLAPGTPQGYSIPADWRHPGDGIIKWSDATIHLGWYIGGLATEHYLLSHPELFPGYARGDAAALDQVRNELYGALSAMNRVDAVAEACFDPLAPDTPGFFIRDDVPATFYTHFPGMSQALSDFSASNIYDKEMSQDQVVHVLLGLTLVKKLVPGSVVVNGMNLRQAAIDCGAAIVDWVHQADWMIKNPVTGNDVARGPDAHGFSTGFNKSVVYLTDGAVDFGGSISGFWAWVWSTLSSPSNPAYDNRNNLHMAMSLAATGNGWGNADTLDDLMVLADVYDWHLYVLLYAALWDPIPQARPTWPTHQQTVNGLVQTMLDNAPASGPHHPIDPSEYNTGWCCDQRFLVTLDAQNYGCGERTGQWFNGADYILLHNLFYVVTPALWEDPTLPAIELSTASISHTIERGASLPAETFTVRNSTIGTLNYTIGDNAAWLQCSPPGGSSTGEADTITIAYTTAGLSIGDYTAAIAVSDPNASNSPQTLTVDLHVEQIATVSPDFDYDRDVDQSDFGHLQVCFSGSGQRPPAGCDDADLNGDSAVDQADLDILLGCMSGANVPANLHCVD